MGRRVGTYFALGWLLLMIFPFAQLFSSRHPPTYVIGGLLGGLAFCAVYAWIWLRQLRWQQWPGRVAGLLALTVLGLALSLADGATWGPTLIYWTVVAGASF